MGATGDDQESTLDSGPSRRCSPNSGTSHSSPNNDRTTHRHVVFPTQGGVARTIHAVVPILSENHSDSNQKDPRVNLPDTGTFGLKERHTLDTFGFVLGFVNSFCGPRATGLEGFFVAICRLRGGVAGLLAGATFFTGRKTIFFFPLRSKISTDSVSCTSLAFLVDFKTFPVLDMGVKQQKMKDESRAPSYCFSFLSET
jgi:hypothetical protein